MTERRSDDLPPLLLLAIVVASAALGVVLGILAASLVR
jgi:hypothetical protein